MTFLYQIERKQAALIAEREKTLVSKQTPKAAPRAAVPDERRAAAVHRPEGQSATMGLPIDSVLSEGMLQIRGCYSKQEALYRAIESWLRVANTLPRPQEMLTHRTRKVELVGKTIIVGVELDAALNTELNAFCKRFGCYKRQVAYDALRWFIRTRGQ